MSEVKWFSWWALVLVLLTIASSMVSDLQTTVALGLSSVAAAVLALQDG